jgi:SAM-dependent methyltransferase
MTPTEELESEIKRLGDIVPWYHAFVLPGNVKIAGWEGIYGVWDNIRAARAFVDYAGARVLDLGCRDGMWAFEAEELEAATVVATDIGCEGYREHIQFIKAVLKSRVGVYFNVPAEDAFNRLDCFFATNPGLFDIVQHLGLLYHVEDPLLSLRQSRKCLKVGGTLLLETAFYLGGGDLPLVLLNCRGDVYNDPHTNWAFNLAALRGALEKTGFRVDETNLKTIKQTDAIGRVCLVAKAI